MLKSKSFYPLLTFCNILFLAYYFMLGYYNQPATDDYCVISAQQSYGINSPISYWYLFWNARIFPLYLSNIFLTFFQITDTTIWFTVFLITGFTFAIYRIIKNTIQILKVTQLPENSQVLNLALFIFNIFVYNNFKFNTFFWLNASTMYFGGIMFFLIGIGEIISSEKKWFTFPLLFVTMAYAGTSTENHALVLVLILFLTILFKKYFGANYSKQFNQKLYFSSTIITLFFLILIAAPGSQHRIISDTVPQAKSDFLSLIYNLFQNFAAKYLLLLGEISLMYIPFFLLSLPILVNLFIDIFKEKITLFIENKHFNFVVLIGSLLLIGAGIAPTIYIFGNIGPQRVLTIVNFVLLFAGLFFCIFCLKNILIYNKIKLLTKVSDWAIILIVLQLGYRFLTEQPTLKMYSAFEINNRKIIKNTPNGQTPIIKNFIDFNTPNLTEQFASLVLGKLAPKRLENLRKIIKHEPILPNIIDKSEIKVYHNCYEGAFKRKVTIKVLQ